MSTSSWSSLGTVGVRTKKRSWSSAHFLRLVISVNSSSSSVSMPWQMISPRCLTYSRTRSMSSDDSTCSTVLVLVIESKFWCPFLPMSCVTRTNPRCGCCLTTSWIVSVALTAARWRRRSRLPSWLMSVRMKLGVKSIGLSVSLARGRARWKTWKPQDLRSWEEAAAKSVSSTTTR